jgi:hypothetical protein
MGATNCPKGPEQLHRTATAMSPPADPVPADPELADPELAVGEEPPPLLDDEELQAVTARTSTTASPASIFFQPRIDLPASSLLRVFFATQGFCIHIRPPLLP